MLSLRFKSLLSEFSTIFTPKPFHSSLSLSKMEDTVFAKLSDDVVLNIFFRLEDDPRNWADRKSVV